MVEIPRTRDAVEEVEPWFPYAKPTGKRRLDCPHILGGGCDDRPIGAMRGRSVVADAGMPWARGT